jgi:hypothetical protein
LNNLADAIKPDSADLIKPDSAKFEPRRLSSIFEHNDAIIDSLNRA